MCWRNEWPLCSKEYHKKKKKVKLLKKKLQQTGKNGTLEHNDDGKEKVKKVISYSNFHFKYRNWQCRLEN